MISIVVKSAFRFSHLPMSVNNRIEPLPIFKLNSNRVSRLYIHILLILEGAMTKMKRKVCWLVNHFFYKAIPPSENKIKFPMAQISQSPTIQVESAGLEGSALLYIRGIV